MAGPLEDICLLAGNPQSLGIHGGPGAASSREREPEPRGHVVAPELPRDGSGSLSHGDTRWPRSCPKPGAGARAAGTHGGPRATPSRERELEPWGHMAAPELPRAESGS
jgi:hypothetical protein